MTHWTSLFNSTLNMFLTYVCSQQELLMVILNAKSLKNYCHYFLLIARHDDGSVKMLKGHTTHDHDEEKENNR